MTNRISSASTVIASGNNSLVNEAYQISNNNNNNLSNEFNVPSSSSPNNYDVNSYSTASMQPVEATYIDDSANNYSLSNSNDIPSYKLPTAQIDTNSSIKTDEIIENQNYYNEPYVQPQGNLLKKITHRHFISIFLEKRIE